MDANFVAHILSKFVLYSNISYFCNHVSKVVKIGILCRIVEGRWDRIGS